MTDARRQVRTGGERFGYPSVVSRYASRPPYPDELYDALVGLMPDVSGAVLDAGCGPGKLALGLADRVGRVDGVDPSEAMLSAARAASGARAGLRWIPGRLEDVELAPPYALAVAGASIHWMNPEIVLPRLADVLAPDARLALVGGDAAYRAPWAEAEAAVHMRAIDRMSHKPSFGSSARYRPADPARPILEHARFRRRGSRVFFQEVAQTPNAYVDALHSRQSFCLEAMGAELAAAFDAEIRALLEPHVRDGLVRFRVFTRLEWGDPA